MWVKTHTRLSEGSESKQEQSEAKPPAGSATWRSCSVEGTAVSEIDDRAPLSAKKIEKCENS